MNIEDMIRELSDEDVEVARRLVEYGYTEEAAVNITYSSRGVPDLEAGTTSEDVSPWHADRLEIEPEIV